MAPAPGDATATKDGKSYTIKGNATGIDMANPMIPVNKPFEIAVTLLSSPDGFETHQRRRPSGAPPFLSANGWPDADDGVHFPGETC